MFLGGNSDTGIDIGKAQYPLPTSHRLVQVETETATGVTHVETFKVRKSEYTYNFKMMPEEYYVDLLDFFLNTAVGKHNELEWEDDYGVVRTGKFLDSVINFTDTVYTEHSLYSGSFTLVETVQTPVIYGEEPT